MEAKTNKRKLTIFLTESTFASLEKLAKLNEQSRSVTASALIRKGTEKYRTNVEEA